VVPPSGLGAALLLDESLTDPAGAWDRLAVNIRLMRRIDGVAGNFACTALAAARRLTRPFLRPRDEVKSIVVMKFFGLGSIVVASPTLAALREHFPRARIHFVTFESNRGILEILGLTDHNHYRKAACSILVGVIRG
jgi:hypothetical protein